MDNLQHVSGRTFPSALQLICRRYSDFEWLQKKLEAEFEGMLVPVIPEKDALCTKHTKHFLTTQFVLPLKLYSTGEDN